MARRPVDYTAQMQAAEERRRLQEERQREEQQKEQQLRERQAISYGQVVLDILGPRVTIDALAGMLLHLKDLAKAEPKLNTEWPVRGGTYFRPDGNGSRKQHAKTDGASGNGAAHPESTPRPQPSRPRAAAAEGDTDLLNGLEADRAGAGTSAEGGNDGERA